MKKQIAIAAVALGVLSMPSFAAAAKHKAKAAPTTYECAKCHMKFDAATAKKDHYKDPMDGGKLEPVKSAAKHSTKAKPMGGMHM